MNQEEKSFSENNPETGTNNVFRKERNGKRPEEAGEKYSETAPASDKGNLGKKTKTEESALKKEEGFNTMDDDESRKGLGGRLPGDEPGA